MNKLYHIFYVSDYKGGELHSQINLTFNDLVNRVDIDIEELIEVFGENEGQDIPDDEWDELISKSTKEILDVIPNSTLKRSINYYFFPGNPYAFDCRSDYDIYTTSEDGKLELIDPSEDIPGFVEAVREHLKSLCNE